MDLLSKLSRLQIEHQNAKVKHEKWIVDNQPMAGTKNYEDYVEQFQKWESEILIAIETVLQTITRRPVEQIPQVPEQDLDGQIFAMLENISMSKFALALVELCKKDPSVFEILTKYAEQGESRQPCVESSNLYPSGGNSFVNGPVAQGPPVLRLGSSEVGYINKVSTAQFTIPAELAGTIIGKSGTRINRIRQDSGAKVELDTNYGTNERIITVTGTSHQIQSAHYQLQQSVLNSEFGRSYLGQQR